MKKQWRLGVVGYPIEHSLSPRLHEAGLAQLGLDGASERMALRESEAGRLGELLGSRFDALSVTSPLKSAAVAVCDDLEDSSVRLGVVNSLLVRDGRILGASTDGDGFLDALRAQFDFVAYGKRAAVLGAGGAARSIVDALARAGATSIAVASRTPERIAWLSARYDQVVATARPPTTIDLVVNTVPAGHRERPEVIDGTTAATVCVDIAYEPRLTPWRQAYADLGCPSANGLGMLVFQAARQMTWWWGRPLDAGALMKAVS
ncbi:MAG: NAD(P)-binding domain-containing protein [Acidobacteriota bacterium]|nr:NAD(P)-binding domain-containing protein [Acidobacteriota bacterium]